MCRLLYRDFSVIPLKNLIYFIVLIRFFSRSGFIKYKYTVVRSRVCRIACTPSYHVQHFSKSYLAIARRTFNELPKNIVNFDFGTILMN